MNKIIHIAGASGSGKTTLGNQIEQAANSSHIDVIVKDLDNLREEHFIYNEKSSISINEFVSTYQTSYQKWIDDFIKENQSKTIVFVGINTYINGEIYWFKNERFNYPQTTFNTHAKYKFYIDIPNEQIIKQLFLREFPNYLEWRANASDWKSIIDDLISNNKLIKEKICNIISDTKLFDFDTINKEIDNWNIFYRDAGYQFMTTQEIFKKVMDLLRISSNFVFEPTKVTNKTSSIQTIIKKPYSATYLVHDTMTPFSYIIKKGSPVEDESKAYQLLTKLESTFITNAIPKVYAHYLNTLIIEYIDGYSGYNLDKINILSDSTNLIHRELWIQILTQIAYFIKVLEENQIQHNDFYLGNIIVVYNPTEKILQLKVFDFETLTDYKDRTVFSDMVATASKEELHRMGWSLEFHPGSDLNQILGEIFERYQNIIPPNIYEKISPLIIKTDNDEFPFAIDISNEMTTGKHILNIIQSMFSK